MRKIIPACLLALCLLVGCTFATTFGSGATQPASALPLVPSSPNITASAPATPQEAPANPALPSVEASHDTSGGVSPVPAAAVSAEPSAAEPTSPQVSFRDEELSDRLDQIFAGWPEFYGSVLIARGSDILLYQGYGMADAEMGVRNTPDTKFVIGSVTKQFTSMAIMQLYAKGLLDIHDTLLKYIPDFSRGGDIALTDLLNQTSGIWDYMNDDPELLSTLTPEELTEEYIIGLAKSRPLKFEPGSKYSYSNTNYLILGYIVEKVSGLSYGDYLDRYILEPLGMKNTGVFDIGDPPKNMATGYTRYDEPVRYFTLDGDVVPEKANATAASFGAGSLYSTVSDLFIWDQALSTEKLLPKKYTDMLFTMTVAVPGALITSDYGFGWIIQTDTDCGTIYVHTGALGGFRAYNGLYADMDMTVIVLFNNMTFPDRAELIPAVKKVLTGQ